jgi:lipoate-protein ligase A
MLFDTAPDGLAAEMALLDAVAAGRAGASAFLWAARAPGLVLPERLTRSGRFADAAARCAATGWPVTARRTGGGITPQGPGVLNLALAFRAGPGKARSLRASYDAICTPLAEALAALGISATAAPVSGSFCDGDYNLAVAGRKIAGTAQRWRGNACLAHALILTDIDLAPAVAAVQRLSDGLGHTARFDLEMHCRLADFPGLRGDVTATASGHIRRAVARRGFAPWDGTAPRACGPA